MRMVSRVGRRGGESAFTLVELLVVIAIVAILSWVAYALVGKTRVQAYKVISINNLRQLAAANLTYAGEFGTFAPAQSPDNLLRWHGQRNSLDDQFDPTKGTLAEYLGASRRVTMCPMFLEHLTGGASFENGTGGYGYNATYVGGTPQDPFSPENPGNLRYHANTVMFTTAAFARGDSVQEYPYTEPFRWVDSNEKLQYPLQPSTHFRFNGKALVAWCDGHVTAEEPSDDSGPNYYGGNNKDQDIGWFGPREENGYWNPRRSYMFREE